MAQKHPSPPETELDDALNLASQFVASMKTQGSGPTTGPLDPSVRAVPDDSFNQLTAPNMLPLPSPNSTTTLPYHEAQQNGVKPAQLDVTARQLSQSAEEDGNPDEPEVDFPRENAQQDAEMPQEIESVRADLTSAMPEDEVSGTSSDEDMSDGSESRVSPESGDDLDRLDKYAFSYAGQAYDHRVPQHLTGGTTLFAKKVTQGITILEHLESAENQDKGSLCPKVEPKEVEMNRTTKAVECVWVGMLPNPRSNPKHAASASAQPESLADAAPSAVQQGGHDDTEPQSHGTSNTLKKVPKRAKKAKPVIDLEDDQLDIIPYNKNNAFRVVAKKMTRTVKIWHLYALTTSADGSELCEGWKVYSDEVFFFKAFRDDTVAGPMKRKQATDLKIKAVIFPANNPPSVVPHPSPPAKHSASDASAPANPTPGGLASPKPSGRKVKASRTVRNATAKQACKARDVPGQEGGHAGSPVGNLEDGNGFGAENQPAAANEPEESGTALPETGQPERTGIAHDDGDEDAYPDFAVSATNSCYKNFLDDMVRELSVVGPSGVDTAHMRQGEKRKRVAFEPGCDDVANTRRKIGDSSRNNEYTRNGLEREGSASFVVQQHTDHMARKLTSIIDKLVAKQDVAGLRQCVTMVESIEKRGCPDPTNALAPYLNVTSKKDATPRACRGKLREILVGCLLVFLVFPFH